MAGYGAEMEETRKTASMGPSAPLDAAAGEQALELHRAGVLGYFSVGFHPIGNGRVRNGVVVRTHCHLDEVSLCREGAYPGVEAAVRAAAREAGRVARPDRDDGAGRTAGHAARLGRARP